MFSAFTSISLAMAVSGVAILLYCELKALASWQNVRRLIIFSTIAEIGFVLMAFSQGELAQLGGGMHLVYQGVMRLLVILALVQLAAAAGGWTMLRLSGIGRIAPYSAILFAFGMFSLLGLSPFKGALSRFIVLYDMALAGQWWLAIAGTIGSIMAAIYAIKVIQYICFAKPVVTHEPQKPAFSMPIKAGMAVLAVITALMNFYPAPVAQVATWLFNFQVPMPEKGGPWPLMATVPYIGAFVLLALGYLSRLARDVVALGVAGATLYLAVTASAYDPVSSLFAILFAGVMLVVTLYSTAYMRHEGDDRPYYFFLFLLLGSLMGLAVAEELGSFYLFFELMTWSSYLLIVHSRSEEALNAGEKYFVMCVSGAYIMHLGIVGIGAYGGTFELAGLAAGLADLPPAYGTFFAILMFVGLAVKAGLVPFHGWLPVAHPAAPSSVSAPLSSILTKCGLLGVFKVLIAGFGVGLWQMADNELFHVGLLISGLGVLTLLLGEFMAWRQEDIKRMLAYSTIAQVGEIVALIGIGTYLALSGALAHVLTHGVMKTLLFLGAGALIYHAGSRKLSDLAGIGRAMPFTAFFLVVGLLAIMGVPPFAGFYSKFLMVYASVEAGAIPIGGALLLGGVIGVLYYSRIIRIVLFEKSQKSEVEVQEAPLPMTIALGLLAVLITALGFAPYLFLDMAASAAGWLTQAQGVVAGALPRLEVDWSMGALVCGAGGVLTYLLGRKSRKIAGGIAVATMTLAFAVIVRDQDRFDTLSYYFALSVAGIGLLNLLHSVGYFAHHGERTERFMATMTIMIGGLIGMAEADDLFTFFFFWEIMSSWTLYFAIIHDESEEALGEGFKYFLFNMIGASFLFLGVTVLGVGAGSFEFAILSEVAPTMDLFTLGLGAFLCVTGFAMKAAMLTMRVDIQMHPAPAPTPVSGYISAVLLKSGPLMAFKLIAILGGTAVLGRMGTVFGLDPISYALAVVGAVTALYAGLMAVIQTGIKRLLIYSTVAQLGYVMCALALGDALSTAGGLAHAFNHALLKNILFLCAGAILAQAHIESLNELGGAAKRMPLTFGMFLFAGLSLAGLPPFNGLGSKWLIYEGALTSGHPFLALLLMGASLTTLAAILKFVHAGFMGTPSKVSEKLHEAPLSMLIPMGLLTAACLVISFLPGVLLVPVSWVQASMGMEAISATWLGPLPGAYGWHPLAIALPMVFFIFVGWLCMGGFKIRIRATHAHTCGVSFDADTTRVAASNLYSAPGRLVRKVLFVRENA